MTTLRLAEDLELPLDYVTKTAAILAQRRKGKTYTAAVIAEELVAAGQPWVALDPTGAWWGLRAGADGDPRGGLPVVVLGGQHGDAPLEVGAGRYVAELVVEEPGWYVLDLSLLDTRSAERTFATDFAEALIRRKRQPGRDFPLHLFVDEADMFVPQEREGAGDVRMLGAFQAIVRRGGLHGLGSTLISQRPALVNKSVLTQLDLLVLLRLVAGQDQDAVNKSYVSRAGTKEQAQELMGSLASLRLGEAWFWEPGAEPPLYQRAQVRQRRTFNSSATPKPGEARVEPKGLAEIDLDAVKDAMAASIERAKAEDPKELQRQVRDLRKENTALQRQLDERGPDAIEVEVPVEVPTFWVPDAVRGQLDLLLTDAEHLATAAQGALDTIRATRDEIDKHAGIDRPGGAQPKGSAPQRPSAPSSATSAAVAAPRPTRRPPEPRPAADHDAVNAPRQKILNAIAWYEHVGVAHPTRAHVAFVAGTSPRSSGYENNLGALRTAGLIDYPAGGRVALTDPGRNVATIEAEISSTAELLAVLEDRLGRRKGAILRVLVDEHPDALTRDDLADRIGVSARSSGFENNLGALRSLGFIDYPQRGWVAATDAVFIGADR